MSANESIAQLQACPGWTYPGLAGFACRGHWADTQPYNTTGNPPSDYNWTYWDAAVALAAKYKKKVSIKVVGGVSNTPSWLTGYQSITLSQGTRPAPWDTTYQAAWANFNQHLAARYDGNPYVSYVEVSGFGCTPSEICEFCVTAADNTTFFSWFGGSQTAAVAAWIQAVVTISGSYAAAFKKTPLNIDSGKVLGGTAGNPAGPCFAAQQQVFNLYGIGQKNVNIEPYESPYKPLITSQVFYAAMGSPSCGFQEGVVGFNAPGNTYQTLLETFELSAGWLCAMYEGYIYDFPLLWWPLINQYNQIFSRYPINPLLGDSNIMSIQPRSMRGHFTLPTVVQDPPIISQLAQNPTYTFPNPVGLGNLLILFFNWGNVSGSVSQVQDNLGNIWKMIDFQQPAGSARTLYCFATIVRTTGTCTVTAYTDASRTYAGSIFEVSKALIALDGTPVHNFTTTNVTTIATGGLATNLTNSIVFAVCRSAGPFSAYPTAPWTSLITGSQGLTIAYQVGAAGPYNASWTFPSSNAITTILAFRRRAA
jgi:hypothetical protein